MWKLVPSVRDRVANPAFRKILRLICSVGYLTYGTPFVPYFSGSESLKNEAAKIKLRGFI